MRVFITGATGYVGGAVTKCLLAAGHEVVGLARSDRSAQRLDAMGAEAHRGELSDLDSLTRGAEAADGVIHIAFGLTDWSQLDAAFAEEDAAVTTMLAALEGTGNPFLHTSGSGVLADTGNSVVDETVETDSTGPVASRAELEQIVLQASERGVRSVVIRPGLVYGHGGSGVMLMLVQLARQAGGGRTIGDGTNVWSAVHLDDLADLYLRALESGPAGALFHAASEEASTMKQVASAIADALNLSGPPTVWSVEEARGMLGPLADGLAANKRISATKARKS
ncbi:MAG: NAD-dependent epimerase/dehydratase family protein [Pseudomonadota bacterium]